jgi:hypothetical protein
MSPEATVNKLSKELSIKLGCENNLDIIRLYVNMALVIGLEQKALIVKPELQMISTTGNVIKEFPRLKDAISYIYELKRKKTQKSTIKVHIGKVIRGAKPTAYGYLWKYKNE